MLERSSASPYEGRLRDNLQPKRLSLAFQPILLVVFDSMFCSPVGRIHRPNLPRRGLPAICRCGKKPICWRKEPRKRRPTGGSMLSNREVEQYRELGYLVVPDVLDAPLLAEVRRMVDGIVAD